MEPTTGAVVIVGYVIVTFILVQLDRMGYNV